MGRPTGCDTLRSVELGICPAPRNCLQYSFKIRFDNLVKMAIYQVFKWRPVHPPT